MTSSPQLDRTNRMTGNASPARPGRRRRRWSIGPVVVVAAGVTAAAAAFVSTHRGNQPLPAGVHQVQVYTVDDAVSTVVPAADRPGVVGRFIGLCDADSYYLRVRGAGLCVTLNGPLGTVQVTGTGRGVDLAADQAARVRDIVRQVDDGSSEPTTRVVLGYDGGWAGMLPVVDLEAAGPVHVAAVG